MSADDRIERIKTALDRGKEIAEARGYLAEAANMNTAILELDEILDEILGEVGAYVTTYLETLRAAQRDDYQRLIDLEVGHGQEADEAIVAMKALVKAARPS